MTVEPGTEPHDRRPHDGCEMMALTAHDEIARVDPHHLDGVADEPLEAIDLLSDDVDELAVPSAWQHVRQEVTARRLHGGQRRFEFMRHGVEHGRAQLAAAMSGLGPRRGFVPPRALEAD